MLSAADARVANGVPALLIKRFISVAAPPAARALPASRRVVSRRRALFAVLILFLAVLYLLRAASFGLQGNLHILATSMSVIGIVAAGQTLVVLTGGIDLSVGSLVALTGIVAASLSERLVGGVSVPAWGAALAAVVLAAGIGWLHGWLIARWKLTPFIVTFGSLSLLLGLAKVLSNAAPISLQGDGLDWLWVNLFGVIPLPTLLMLITFGVLALVLHQTRLGRYLYAVGSNETAAHLSGVNTAQVRQAAYAISGGLAGVAGLLMMAQIKGGMYGNGQGYELLSVAAVIIGGTSLRGGSGGVWGTLVGMLVIMLVRNGLILYDVPWVWGDAVIGAFILGAALLDARRREAEGRAATLTPAPSSAAPTPLVAGSLEEALTLLTEAVRAQVSEAEAIRTYVCDPETGALVAVPAPNAEGSPHGPASLVQQARDSRQVHLSTSSPAGQADDPPSAALPLLNGGRMVGVVELQARRGTTLAGRQLAPAVEALGRVAGLVEEQWLLDSGWLYKQVRDCLKSLHDDSALERAALTDWYFDPKLASRLLSGGTLSRAAALRSHLLDAIDQVQPEPGHEASRTTRRAQILRLAYVDEKTAEAILLDLGLSRRQYFYDLKEAVEAVTYHLVAARRATSARAPLR
jgi:ribose/xylose/arabinose/galactoside ABC-type transport system permease subunit